MLLQFTSILFINIFIFYSINLSYAHFPPDYKQKEIIPSYTLFHPTYRPMIEITDFDNDARKDLLVGDISGTIKFYKNQHTDSQPLFEYIGTVCYYNTTTTRYEPIQLGKNSTPRIIDWNNDTVVDLLCGEGNGRLYLFLGSATLPAPPVGLTPFLPPQIIERSASIVSNFAQGNDIFGIAISGGYAVLANGFVGIDIYDVRNIQSPKHIVTEDTDGFAYDVYIAGCYALVADGNKGLQVIDVSELDAPDAVAEYIPGGIVRCVVAEEDIVYLACTGKGIYGVVLSDLLEDAEQIRYAYSLVPSSAQGIAVGGGYIYVANGADTTYPLEVYEVIPSPGVGSRYERVGWGRGTAITDGAFFTNVHLDLGRNLAFVAGGRGGLYVFDISIPNRADLTQRGRFDTLGYATDVKVVGDYALVADGHVGVQIIDISDPANMKRIATIDTPGEAYAIEIVGDYAYVADRTGGVQIIDISILFAEDKSLDVGYNSSPYFFDLNEDNKKDLIIGDEDGYVWFYKNVGNEKELLFGVGVKLVTDGVTIDVGQDACPYIVDYNNDGFKDLIVGDKTGNVYFFPRQPFGTLTLFYAPQYIKISNNAIDVGWQASPVVIDYNNDGYLDLLVAEYYGSIFLFENTKATLNVPTFYFAEKVKAHTSTFKLSVEKFSAPCIVDLNLDCKKDLIVGDKLGFINLFLNSGSDAEPLFSGAMRLLIGTGTLLGTVSEINLCGVAKPTIVDYDADGDLDLLVGNENGNIYPIINLGNKSAPLFTIGSATMAGTPSVIIDVGYNAAPYATDINNDGLFDLIVGNSLGDILIYYNTGRPGSPSFAAAVYLTTEDGQPIKTSINAKPIIIDINKDQKKDLIVSDKEANIWIYLNIGAEKELKFSKEQAYLLEDLKEELLSYSGEVALDIADYNNDHVLDLIVGVADGSIFVYLGKEGPDFCKTYIVHHEGYYISSGTISFVIYPKNLGATTTEQLKITVPLDAALEYLSSTPVASYLPASHSIIWDLTADNYPASLTFTTKILTSTPVGYKIYTYAIIEMPTRYKIKIKTNILEGEVLPYPSFNNSTITCGYSYQNNELILDYSIIYRYVGYKNAEAVKIKVNIPNSVSYIPGSNYINGIKVAEPTPLFDEGINIGNLSSGAFGYISFKVKVLRGGEVITVATITATGIVHILIDRFLVPEFKLVLLPDNEIVRPNDLIFFHINYKNESNTLAKDVKIKLFLDEISLTNITAKKMYHIENIPPYGGGTISFTAQVRENATNNTTILSTVVLEQTSLGTLTFASSHLFVCAANIRLNLAILPIEEEFAVNKHLLALIKYTNIGNATCKNLKIIAYLDDHLQDINKTQYLGYSLNLSPEISALITAVPYEYFPEDNKIEWHLGDLAAACGGTVAFVARIDGILPDDYKLFIKIDVFYEDIKAKKLSTYSVISINSKPSLVNSIFFAIPDDGISETAVLNYYLIIANEALKISKQEVIRGPLCLDLMGTFSQFTPIPSGKISIHTPEGKYQSKNLEEYPNIKALIEDINKANIGINIEYSEIFDRFIITHKYPYRGFILSEEVKDATSVGFFTAINIPIGLVLPATEDIAAAKVKITLPPQLKYVSGSLQMNNYGIANEAALFNEGLSVSSQGELPGVVKVGKYVVLKFLCKVVANFAGTVTTYATIAAAKYQTFTLSAINYVDLTAPTPPRHVREILPQKGEDIDAIEVGKEYKVAWEAAHDPESTIEAYLIYEKEGIAGEFKKIAEVPANQLYIKLSKQKKKDYYYAIYSKNSANRVSRRPALSDGIKILDAATILAPTTEQLTLTYNAAQVIIMTTATVIATSTLAITELQEESLLINRRPPAPFVESIFNIYEIVLLPASYYGSYSVPNKEIKINILYSQKDTKEKFYRIYRYSEENKRWEIAEGKQTVNLAENKVELLTKQIGIFGIAVPTSPEQINIQVYPNPYEDDKYTEKYIHFYLEDLSDRPYSLYIYNITGELIFKKENIVSTQEEDGCILHWELKNNACEEIAPGIYIYVIKTKNQLRRGKVAIIK